MFKQVYDFCSFGKLSKYIRYIVYFDQSEICPPLTTDTYSNLLFIKLFFSGNGHNEVLRFMLKQPKINEVLMTTDSCDSSPAHDAAANGHLECLRSLVEARMDIHVPDQASVPIFGDIIDVYTNSPY